jgi:hypothetical protein
VTSDRVFIHTNGERVPIDVIDREFKLPGFTNGHGFHYEAALVRACLEGKADMLGSVLPYGDKLLLSTIFETEDDEFTKLHAETDVLDGSRSSVRLGNEQYNLDDVRELRPEFSLVLKRGGDTIGATGSKGLMISSDVQPDTWRRQFDTAVSEPLQGGSFWVVQRVYESRPYMVHTIKNSRSQPKTYDVITRFAPYYVRSDDEMQLGNVLVTAGTDRETRVKHIHNVHGLRDNAYQAAEVK